MEIALDGKSSRLDDPAVFGEMGRDAQGLASRKEPRTFYVRPNTALAFGGSIQTPGVTADCDLSLIDLQCPGRRRLVVDPATRMDPSTRMGPETGSGELAYKLNPVNLRGLAGDRARFGAGSHEVEVVSVFGKGLQWRTEEVPYAPSGLAAGSLVSFLPNATDASTRLVAGTDDDVMVFAFCNSSAKAQVRREDGGFALNVGGREYVFGVSRGSGGILRPIYDTVAV